MLHRGHNVGKDRDQGRQATNDGPTGSGCMACNDGWVRFNTPRLIGDTVAAVFRLEWDGGVGCIRQITDAKFCSSIIQKYQVSCDNTICAEDSLIAKLNQCLRT